MADEVKNYNKLKKRIIDALRAAKKLGVRIERDGAYGTGASINRVPEYSLGLYGALSIVEGRSARNSLGLSYEQTLSLENGFNGLNPPKRKDKKAIYPDLYELGNEIACEFCGKRDRYEAGGKLKLPKPTFSFDSGPSTRSTAFMTYERNIDIGPIRPAASRDIYGANQAEHDSRDDEEEPNNFANEISALFNGDGSNPLLAKKREPSIVKTKTAKSKQERLLMKKQVLDSILGVNGDITAAPVNVNNQESVAIPSNEGDEVALSYDAWAEVAAAREAENMSRPENPEPQTEASATNG